MALSDLRLIDIRKYLTELMRYYSSEEGSQVVWKTWKNMMLCQGREVKKELLTWPIPNQDKLLDEEISVEVIEKFLMYVFEKQESVLMANFFSTPREKPQWVNGSERLPLRELGRSVNGLCVCFLYNKYDSDRKISTAIFRINNDNEGVFYNDKGLLRSFATKCQKTSNHFTHWMYDDGYYGLNELPEPPGE